MDPREILKGVEALLGKDGELRSLEGVPKVFRSGTDLECDKKLENYNVNLYCDYCTSISINVSF